MTEYTQKKLIPELQRYFKQQPVDRAWLFGSYSRGEETANSDVDILVRFQNGVTLMSYARIYRMLCQLLNKEVDLVEENTLLPFAQETANQDKILIYERETA